MTALSTEELVARIGELERALEIERDATRAREEILSSVSHDLRNPLNTIVMGSTVLLSSPDKRVQMCGQRIHRQAERMARLVGDLVDFANIQAGQLALERAAHAPLAIVAATSELFGPIAEERGLALIATATSELPAIECDSHRAVQVLSNLVSNALKVTPRGGEIEIGAAPRDREVVFFVRDSGPGIAHDELPQLFERSWRSKDLMYKGAGLGLSIARGIVDAHGGRIWAESRLGIGSTFYFSLAA